MAVDVVLCWESPRPPPGSLIDGVAIIIVKPPFPAAVLPTLGEGDGCIVVDAIEDSRLALPCGSRWSGVRFPEMTASSAEEKSWLILVWRRFASRPSGNPLYPGRYVLGAAIVVDRLLVEMPPYRGCPDEGDEPLWGTPFPFTAKPFV